VPDPNDGRSSLVELTDKGHDVVRRAGPAHLDTERRILAALTPDEREVLARLLKKLLVSFEQGDRRQLRPARLPSGRR
jgi:DNA-binding MarR family transcriptional regulator